MLRREPRRCQSTLPRRPVSDASQPDLKGDIWPVTGGKRRARSNIPLPQSGWAQHNRKHDSMGYLANFGGGSGSTPSGVAGGSESASQRVTPPLGRAHGNRPWWHGRFRLGGVLVIQVGLGKLPEVDLPPHRVLNLRAALWDVEDAGAKVW